MAPTLEEQRKLADARLYRLKLFREQPHSCPEVITVIDRMIAAVQAERDRLGPLNPPPPGAA